MTPDGDDALWRFARALLFRFDAETAHHATLTALAALPRLSTAAARWRFGPPASSLARDVAGVRWAGPVGLAAGLDKDGVAIPFWAALGFGAVEVGTVTAHPQPGNPRPRLFRRVPDRAIINRMGFNNHGSAALADRLGRLRDSGRWPSVPVGANLGKSKVTPLEGAPDDYATSARRLAGRVDWFTINVSSPNTPGLRSLQEPDALGAIVDAVRAEAGRTPVFVKLAPDLTDEALDQAVELVVSRGASGLIATNTTVTRPPGLSGPEEAGGLSGRPLWPLARDRIARVLRTNAGRVPVIGVGGIERVDQARELVGLGCAAVQLYSSLIFAGPALPSRLHRAWSP